MYATKATSHSLHSEFLANREGRIHKFLIHGAGIAKHYILPIGQMTVETLEARHKEIRILEHIAKNIPEKFVFELKIYLMHNYLRALTLLTVEKNLSFP